MKNRTNVPRGVLLEDIKISSPGEGEKTDTRCGRRKLPAIIGLAATLLLIGAGYVLFNNGGSEINTGLGNVKGQLTDIEYETPSDPLVPREEIPVRPVVTNTGDANFYAFLTLTIPYSTVDGDIVEWYDAVPATSWTQIDRRVDDGSVGSVTYVYAYESERDNLISVEPGNSTESLFDDDHKLTVGAIGLLTEADRTDSTRSKVAINYHVCQSKMMDGLTDTQVFEAILDEEGGL